MDNKDMIARSDLALDGEDWIAHVVGLRQLNYSNLLPVL